MKSALKYTGITGEVWSCLLRQAARNGLTVPPEPQGTLSAQGASARYSWNEAEGTLEITVGALPAWLDPALVELRLGQAIRGCGGR